MRVRVPSVADTLARPLPVAVSVAAFPSGSRVAGPETSANVKASGKTPVASASSGTGRTETAFPRVSVEERTAKIWPYALVERPEASPLTTLSPNGTASSVQSPGCTQTGPGPSPAALMTLSPEMAMPSPAVSFF